MRELRAPVAGRHRFVHVTIWILIGAIGAFFVLPPILGIVLVLLGGSD